MRRMSVKLVNALNKPPLKLSLSYQGLSMLKQYRISNPTMKEIGATNLGLPLFHGTAKSENIDFWAYLNFVSRDACTCVLIFVTHLLSRSYIFTFSQFMKYLSGFSLFIKCKICWEVYVYLKHVVPFRKLMFQKVSGICRSVPCHSVE